MPDNGKWPYVSRSAPCQACGRTDWCQVSPDGGMGLCRRAQSDKPSKRGDGWFHRLAGGKVAAPATPAAAAPPTPRRNDLHLLARRFTTSMHHGRMNLLARRLDLTPESLARLELGWCAGEPMLTSRGTTTRVFAYSFPMRDPETGAVVGLRMRSQDDRKFAFTGGRGGLFVPRGMRGGRAYLLEGPTDTAAALDLGLNAFGRESCSAGVDLIVAMLRKWRFEELVIISQRDEAKPRDKRRPELGVFFPGQDGAHRIAGIARVYVPSVRVIMPPEGAKDVRVWKRQGATAADVEREVLRTPSRKLRITSSITRSTLREGVCK